MPRTRLVWHLFAGWCGLIVTVAVASFWISSVQIARLADEAQRRRLTDAGRGIATLLAPDGGPINPDAFGALARDARRVFRVEFELLTADGRPVPATDAMEAAGETSRGPAASEAALLAEAQGGRVVAASRYDVATGRRFLAVFVPHGPPGRPDGIVRVSADTGETDRELARSQLLLLAGHAICAALALVAGHRIARRLVAPLQSLSAAAARLASGEFDAAFPATDLAEVGELSRAFGLLREQIVERGLLIGRQDTQQEAVLGSMIEGVLAIDARQRIVGLNRAAAELLGLDLERSVRRPLQEVVRNPDLRRFALKAIDCREPVEDDLVLHGVRDRTIRLRGTALRDLSGEGGAVIVLNDVTDMQRLETVRRDFVANVSHELKTPVASIKGFVETLLDGAADDPEDSRRFLDIIAKQADRLAAIIEDLLALSRIEQSEGAGNLPVEPARIAAVFAATVGDCGPRAADRSVTLSTLCPETLLAEVNAPLLEQALINLVDNAIKHSDPGGTIWLSAEAEAAAGEGRGTLVIAVRDEGCGIEAEHLPRLFERFYRVDRARSRRLGGTGLGLSIVKHIVQAHGGAIAVESEPAVGTTFTIRIPLARGAAVPA